MTRSAREAGEPGEMAAIRAPDTRTAYGSLANGLTKVDGWRLSVWFWQLLEVSAPE